MHLQWWNYALLPEFAAIASIARMRGAAIVVTVHNATPHEATRLRSWCNRRGALLGDRVIVHTEATLRSLVEQGIPAERVSIIPHGVRADRRADAVRRAEARQRLQLRDNEPVLLHFGTLRPYKRTLELLDEFAERPDGHLIIAGAPWGDYGIAVQNRVAALRLEHRVTLDLRSIDDETKERYYAAADIAAVPRHMDAASGAVAEAISYGLELEGWDGDAIEYLPWGAVADRTANLYRELVGLAGRADEDRRAA